MNKLLTKVARLALGLSLAAGVGVAIGSNKAAERADAASLEITPSNLVGWNSTQGSQSGSYGGITISSNNAANNTQLRFYSGGSHTFTSSVGNITKAVFTCTANGTSNYGPGKMSGNGYTASSGKTGTWEGNAASFTLSGGQARVTSIVFTYTAASITEATSMTITPSTSTTIYAGESVTFTTSLSGGSGAYEKTIGWTSNNSSIITAPANSEEGDSVTVTAASSVASQTTVRLTGTVVSPGSASGYIDIVVKPARVMTSIALHGTITKTSYYVGDSWDLDGLDLQVNWSEGDPTYVGLDDASVVYECSPSTATNTSTTSFDIEVIYDEFDETFTVDGLTVGEHPLTDVFDNSYTNTAAQSGWTTFSDQEDYTGVKYTIYTMKPSTGKLLQWNANGYLIATNGASGLRLKSVSIESISSGKTLGVFASNSAYSAKPTESRVATLSDSVLSYEFEDDYSYIGLTGLASSTAVGTLTIEYESLDPTMEFTSGGTTASLHVMNGSTNSTTFEAENFTSTVTASLFSNTSGSHSTLSYSVSGTTVTVTATGTSVGDDSFTISATRCATTLTLDVTVQASTTFNSLVISTASTATEFNEDDPFAVTSLVVTANYTIGGSPSTAEFSAAEGNLDQLTYTVGGNVMEIGDSLTSTGTLAVVVSYTDNTTGTTRSASSYNITVNAYVAHTWTKVTSAPADWRGTYLLGYEKDGTAYFFNSGLATFDAVNNNVSTTNISGDTVTGSKTIDAASVKIERNTVSGTSYYHAKCANGEYLKSASKSINHQQTATAANAVTFDEVSLKIGDYWLRFNTAADQLRFRFGDSSYLSSYTASLYKMDVTTVINTEVSSLVSGFHTALGSSVCKTDGTTDVSALNSTWTSQATAFAALSVDAQGILANTTYTHNAETSGSTADIVDRYDYIYSRYSESLTKGDFMNRSGLASYQATGTLNAKIALLNIVSINGTSISIIVVVSLVSLTAIGGYFFIRRRKEN